MDFSKFRCFFLSRGFAPRPHKKSFEIDVKPQTDFEHSMPPPPHTHTTHAAKKRILYTHTETRHKGQVRFKKLSRKKYIKPT